MAQPNIGSFTTTGSGPSIGSFQNADNFQMNNPRFTSVAHGPNISYFRDAHHFQIIDSTFTNISGDYIYHGPSEYLMCMPHLDLHLKH